MCLGKKKGSVRLLGMLGVLAGREWEERVQNDGSVFFFLADLEEAFSLSSLMQSKGGWALSSGESRWRCRSEMNQQKRDGEGYALLYLELGFSVD
jgi:hypothetical protein